MWVPARSNSSLLRLRFTRAIRHLYPGFVARDGRFAPLSLLSISYVLSIIASGVYLVSIAIIPSIAAQPLRNGVLLFGFAWCIIMCTASYLLTVCVDPGRIPDSWRPQPPFDNEITVTTATTTDTQPPHPPAVDVVTMLNKEGQPRYCTKCRIFKPDRAHHCSSCNRCVLLMDHHCPFTGNSCIGFSNRKFFVLFLYYASAGCVMVSVISPRAILKRIDNFAMDNIPVHTSDVFWIIAVMFAYMLCFVHALALGGFAAFHTYLVLRNRTTIESNEPRQALHGEALKRMDSSSVYHWRAIMGQNPLLWFIPVSLSRDGDGVHWRRMDEV